MSVEIIKTVTTEKMTTNYEFNNSENKSSVLETAYFFVLKNSDTRAITTAISSHTVSIILKTICIHLLLGKISCEKR